MPANCRELRPRRVEKIASKVCEQPVDGMAFSHDSQRVIIVMHRECIVLELKTGKRLLRIERSPATSRRCAPSFLQEESLSAVMEESSCHTPMR